ncbi:MAG TPA: cytochrome P460 family protein, partial [Blastocatellia bacterium]|nr:cytochrome P460 family protein [Blastocatellia bacterium]
MKSKTLTKRIALACFAWFVVWTPLAGRKGLSAPSVVLSIDQTTRGIGQPVIQNPCPDAKEAALPLPSTIPRNQMPDFEKRVYQFLDQGQYKKWCRDKLVRDTGPFIAGVYYGTHPAVMVYYSPLVMKWLVDDKRKDPIPDGAMIIKEQYSPPAARYHDKTEAQLEEEFAKSKNWTVMIRDSAGSKDGWYWGEFYPGMDPDESKWPYNYPNTGFGQYCLRCHGSAENELTFASLNNIAGFPGQPLTFRVDNSWRNLSPEEKPYEWQHRRPEPVTTPAPPVETNADFLQTFRSIERLPFHDVRKMPGETLDRVFPSAKGPEQFLGSDQCMMCHSAATGPYGPTMFVQTAPPRAGTPYGFNVSPYGEWRWSPMGLAGRDPIFHAQLESEIEILKSEFNASEQVITATINTCLSCHGGMGKRQFDIDQRNPAADFKLDFIYLT